MMDIHASQKAFRDYPDSKGEPLFCLIETLVQSILKAEPADYQFKVASHVATVLYERHSSLPMGRFGEGEKAVAVFARLVGVLVARAELALRAPAPKIKSEVASKPNEYLQMISGTRPSRDEKRRAVAALCLRGRGLSDDLFRSLPTAAEAKTSLGF